MPEVDAEVLNRLRGSIDAMGPGALAELRRDRERPVPSEAFWSLAARYVPDGRGWRDRDDWERRWAVIMSGMAAMSGMGGGRRGLADALVEADVSEERVVRLLRARGAMLHDVVRGIVHQLGSRGIDAHWHDLADLILSDGEFHEETVRRRIARGYYGRLARLESSMTTVEGEGSR